IFNENTGYPIKDLNSNSMLLDNNGIIWAGCGDNKLIRFDYDAINRDREPLKLQIENIKVNNTTVCWNNLLPNLKPGKKPGEMVLINEMVTSFGHILKPDVLDSMRESYNGISFDSIGRFYPVPVNLILPNKFKNITIDFTAIETGKPKQVMYQYKLEGYDKDWSPSGNGTTAVFGNIPEGSYIFKLKALSPAGVWSSTSYNFTVLPPWYRTWWAFLIYILSFVLTILYIIRRRSVILLKQNRRLEHKVRLRTNEVIQQKEAIELQRDDLEQAISKLKVMQAQLIHTEKMASLGELTAGIAHEIQNPLNFVNNFSEVNKEMIVEMKEELKSGNNKGALTIANDIELNEDKINHHGKRADAIVKGMLQHSQSGSGSKEPTNINSLADEYMRLSYHGVRAKDKDFKAELVSHFDRDLPKIDVVPQDIGRVLLNLFNNAFYAVHQKQKNTGNDYKPEVIVTTTTENGQVVIKVKDNGAGIPDAIKAKIMQPFFTTKPTGEGTGLGLSLTYDMVVKGHGGTIDMNSKEGEGSEFIITLPL
ncbi:MAG TPA: HAMP domain-containing sensor histidine kinase, partial [Bacteroidia bacterium]|nr:HAMP domain-containing sensor histidine kinase [Bacteroidia bacterium]